MPYEGWSNWETWAVDLWAENTAAFYQQFQGIMADMMAVEQSGEEVGLDDYWLRLRRVWDEVINHARSHGDTIDRARVDWDELKATFLARYSAYKQYNAE